MALGDLSSDQRRYVDLVAAGTGLSTRVVTAWVGCESGWGLTKPSHNYLNVGPGRSYPSTQAAAQDAIDTAKDLDITKAVGFGEDTQVEAIAGSRWGTGRQCLADTYVDLFQQGSGGYLNDPLGQAKDDVQDAASGVAGAVIEGVGKLLAPAGRVFLIIVISGLFTTAGLGLIAMGLSRLTGKSLSDRVGQAANLASATTGAAAAF